MGVGKEGQEDPWVLTCVTWGIAVPLNGTGKGRWRRDLFRSS